MDDFLPSGSMPGEPLTPDPELGVALREALAMPHDGAFVTRLRALVRQRPERTWDEVLAGWFWQGVLAMSLVAMAAAAGSMVTGQPATLPLGEESLAVQLLDSDQPGSEVILNAMAGPR